MSGRTRFLLLASASRASDASLRFTKLLNTFPGENLASLPELVGSLKLGNVWVFVQLIFGTCWSTNQLNKNPNIAELETSYHLASPHSVPSRPSIILITIP